MTVWEGPAKMRIWLAGERSLSCSNNNGWLNDRSVTPPLGFISNSHISVHICSYKCAHINVMVRYLNIPRERMSWGRCDRIEQGERGECYPLSWERCVCTRSEDPLMAILSDPTTSHSRHTLRTVTLPTPVARSKTQYIAQSQPLLFAFRIGFSLQVWDVRAH